MNPHSPDELGFRKALKAVLPATRHQRCWVNKASNVLNKLHGPSSQPRSRPVYTGMRRCQPGKLAPKLQPPSFRVSVAALKPRGGGAMLRAPL